MVSIRFVGIAERQFELLSIKFNKNGCNLIKAKQGSLNESVEWLRLALSKGFKNRSLLVTDKDLDAIKGSQGFREIVQKMN